MGAPKVAIVHDWLLGGGAELVVEQLHELYPDAPIYTSYATDEWRQRLHGKVVTGWLQHFGKVRKYIPFLRIWWFTRLDLRDYDLVISSSGAEAKGVKRLRQNALHVNYAHAPTHYYWGRYDEYLQHPGFGKFDFLARIGLKLLLGPLRRWDYRAAQRPNYLIANSTHTEADIQQYYNRESVVVHPPVYFKRFQKPENAGLARAGFLISGRQTPYKRFDLAVQACTNANVPLTVIGDGPDNARLKQLAGSSITFLGRVTDQALERQFASASALLFPGTDDFGITAIEALAAGTPVIAYQAGGALDYVQPQINGQFFSEPTVQSLGAALASFQADQFDEATVRQTAEPYRKDLFKTKIANCINNWYNTI